MTRQQPILSLRQVREHFDKGEQSITLSKFEWDAIMEIVEPAMSIGADVSMQRLEIARIKRIARPLWKACERVSRQMAKCGCAARPERIREWRFYLDQARCVYWQDLPQRLRAKWRNYT